MATLFALCVAPAFAFGGSASNLPAFLLKKGDESGYVRQGQVQTGTGASAWANAIDTNTSSAADIKRWQSEGLVAGATVQLTTPGGNEGVSWVEQFKSSASAKREAAYDFSTNIQPTKTARVTKFSVPGVPQAKGYAYSSNAKHAKPTADNVLWTEGTCALLLGNYDPSGLSTSSIAKAVTKIYRRTGRTCPS